ncbi:MFS transporter [Aspergillus ibericus CBS 121593]|uniref:MFS general substrate transporter n=1 Tax=Aspergillus ibericus CBS 121593 TaxID=1448316 RepID=A0A395GVM1_9EURO|nr:MFS general substrate transporter [Aspergillus ibericus CBS 121593]RAK99555.1 MFS general substrate transporter [Aspergillus ibericus CBS 121593]
MLLHSSTTDVEKQAGRQILQVHESNRSQGLLSKRSAGATVDWDRPDDPENPLNWPTSKTPLASSMFTPGLRGVMSDFHTTNATLGSVVTVFVLGYMVGPFVIAPLSEIYGRVPVYHVCNVLFYVFTVVCAVAQTLPQLIVFRLLAGVGGACPLTIGSGTVADMVPLETRAGIMAAWALGPILGPVVGSVAGGFLSEAEGWRWVFWVIAIATGVITIGCILCYHESYALVLLERKAARLRKETGSPNLQSKYYTSPFTTHSYLNILARPMKLLAFLSIVLILSLFAAITYGYLYLMFTTIPLIFKHLRVVHRGGRSLYLGFGLGSVTGLASYGVVSYRLAVKHAARGTFTPECRLPPMAVGCWFVPIGLTHWIVPIIGTGVFALGLMMVFIATNAYLVEGYLKEAASVTAASTVLRSLVGAVLPLGGPALYDRLGVGWGNSLLAFMALTPCVCPGLFWRYGERIRTHPRFQLRL